MPFGTGIVIKTGLSLEKYNVFVTFTRQEKNDNVKSIVIITKNALKFKVCKKENMPNFITTENIK